MKTIQMTLEEELLIKIDKTIRELNITRSAFIRESLRYYLEQLRIKKLEKKHLEGYLRHPVIADEFNIWEKEQIWEQ
ncbi:ribbon-helix-helix protein, CopG family [candidate division KSB1 bacterium]|nr:ribbon-helix-helix protein, CopG family [candidate division KSB1 bacterium]